MKGRVDGAVADAAAATAEWRSPPQPAARRSNHTNAEAGRSGAGGVAVRWICPSHRPATLGDGMLQIHARTEIGTRSIRSNGMSIRVMLSVMSLLFEIGLSERWM